MERNTNIYFQFYFSAKSKALLVRLLKGRKLFNLTGQCCKQNGVNNPGRRSQFIKSVLLLTIGWRQSGLLRSTKLNPWLSVPLYRAVITARRMTPSPQPSIFRSSTREIVSVIMYQYNIKTTNVRDASPLVGNSDAALISWPPIPRCSPSLHPTPPHHPITITRRKYIETN